MTVHEEERKKERKNKNKNNQKIKSINESQNITTSPDSELDTAKGKRKIPLYSSYSSSSLSTGFGVPFGVFNHSICLSFLLTSLSLS